MKKRMILMLAIVGLVFGGIFGFKAVGNYFMNQAFDTMPVPPATITATEAREDRWTPTETAVGSFAPINGANLTTETGGIVAEIHFENGSPVSAGDRLVSLDTRADEAELARLVALQNLAELEEKRAERLFEENSIAESELQARQSEAAQARATVQAQEARIRLKVIRSPFDGVAGIRRVNVGQFVAPGDPVVAVESLEELYLNFTLPGTRVAAVHEGQKVTAGVDAFRGETFTGEITALEPSIRESTRTAEIQATFANPERKLRPGMFARVELALGEAETVLVVPRSAIQFNPYGDSVFVVEGEETEELKVNQRFVRTGQARGDLIEVVSGLEKGDRVASSGLLKLRNEAPVRISDNSEVQPSAELEPRPENN